MWKRRNKYGNSRTRVSSTGRVYHSKREAYDAIWLHGLLRDGKIKAIEEQVSVRLTFYNEDGTRCHCFGSHIVDFKVTLNDGRQKFVETKGYPSQIWKQFKKPGAELVTGLPYLVNPTLKELLS